MYLLKNHFEKLSLKWKLFLGFFSAIFLGIGFTIVFHVREEFNHWRQVAVEETVEMTTLIGNILVDHLYRKEISALKRHLKSMTSLNIKNIAILSPDGILIVSKRLNYPKDAFNLFKKFKKESINTDLCLERNNLVECVAPLVWGNKLLGYIVVERDLSEFNASLEEHLKFYSVILFINFIIVLIIAWGVSSIAQRKLMKALEYLDKIGKGEFDIPFAPPEGDEIGKLISKISETASKLKEITVIKDYYEGLINSFPKPLLIINKEGIIEEANKTFCQMFNIDLEKIKNTNLKDFCPEFYKLFKEYEESLESQPREYTIKVTSLNNGRETWFSVIISRVRYKFIFIVKDITSVVKREKQLKELAEKDPLTGLLNRRSFWANLERELEMARKTSQPLSIMMIDLDNFKYINDTYGHKFGDEVLKQSAEFFKNIFRKEDIVARYGGDEFCVILKGTDRETAELLAKRFENDLKEFNISAPDGKILNLEASVGIATFPEDGEDPETLFRTADRKMYKLKQEKKKLLSNTES